MQGPARSSQKGLKLEAPCDYFLLPKMKIQLKGQIFEDIVGIQIESQAVLDSIREQEFQRCFQHWHRCWAQCINSKSDHATRDNTNL
jgi:dipeptidase